MFYFYQLLPDAVEALLDGGFGGACDVGDFAERMTVDVEEEEFAVVVVLEAVDETVEGLVAEVGGFVGEDVVDAFVVFHKEWHALSLAYFLTGDVEGDARDPCVEVAFAAEGGPSLPEGAGDFLVKVAEVVAAAVGEVEAYLHQGALAVAEHLEEFCLLSLVGFHSVSSPFFVLSIALVGEISPFVVALYYN